MGMPPELIFIPDADGDDVPDGPHEVLLDGWGIHDRHETLNSFIWGPDGWMYGCHGVFTRSEVGKPVAAKEDRKFIDGGIWRFHPQTKEFEIFAEGLSNPWGFDFNDMGQGFATCCVIPHLFHIVQGGVYHKQSKQNVNPYVYDNIKTIRDHVHKSAHGGARFIWPACSREIPGPTFHVQHSRACSADRLHGTQGLELHWQAWARLCARQRFGLGRIQRGDRTGRWNLYLDWHDQNICGNVVKFANSARVYRIMPKGVKGPGPFDLEKLSDLELVEMQNHSNDWLVRQSRTILQHRYASGKLNAVKVHGNLESMMKKAKSVGKRLRALWALQVTGGFEGKDAELMALLDDSEQYVQSWAIQFLSEDKKPSDAMLAKFSKMAKSDPSRVVRLYLASALQRFPHDDRWSILEGLASHEEDKDDNNLPHGLVGSRTDGAR